MLIEQDVDGLTALQTAHGQRSMLFSHTVRVLCKIVSVLVVARLVSPADHGLYAMAATLTYLLMVFRDLGLGTAAVQAAELTDVQRASLWWSHFLLGWALAVLSLALIPLVIWFYHEPRVSLLLAVVSIHYVLSGLNAWPRALLARELKFAAINRIETRAVVVGTIAMILTAALHGGAYSFAAFLIIFEAVATVESWRAAAWRPTSAPRFQSLRPLLDTGLHVTGTNLILFFAQQLDSLLVGRWFGPRVLGLYTRSTQLLFLPALHVAAPLNQVLLPALARTSPSSPEFTPQLRATTNLILHLTLPLAALCLILPEEITRLVLGAPWLDAAPLLRWMAISTALAAVTATGYALNVATGHARRQLGLALVSVAANAFTLWLARGHGVTGIAMALATANGLLLVPRLWWTVRATPVRIADYAAAAIGPLAVSVSLAAGAYIGARLVPADAGLPARLLLALGFGAVAVALLCGAWARPRKELRHVWNQRPRWRDVRHVAGSAS